MRLLNKLDQYNAYQRAITMLKNDQNVYVCNIIFELATWLYKNNYPHNDIEENLNQAADILLEIEPIFDEEEGLADEGRSVTSRKSSSSRSKNILWSGISCQVCHHHGRHVPEWVDAYRQGDDTRWQMCRIAFAGTDRKHHKTRHPSRENEDWYASAH